MCVCVNGGGLQPVASGIWAEIRLFTENQWNSLARDKRERSGESRHQRAGRKFRGVLNLLRVPTLGGVLLKTL